MVFYQPKKEGSSRANALLTRIGYGVSPSPFSAQKAPWILRLLAKLSRSDDGRRFPSRSFVSPLRIKRFSRKMHLVARTTIQFIPSQRYLPFCIIINAGCTRTTSMFRDRCTYDNTMWTIIKLNKIANKCHNYFFAIYLESHAKTIRFGILPNVEKKTSSYENVRFRLV